MEENITPNLTLSGDTAQLQELINILLDNACKYAPPNSIITVNLYQQDKKIHLTVHNNSEPLSKDTLSHLFERFYRADHPAPVKPVATGWGLPSQKAFVNTIKATSPPTTTTMASPSMSPCL
jgi:signal transduction histidine kinase